MTGWAVNASAWILLLTSPVNALLSVRALANAFPVDAGMARRTSNPEAGITWDAITRAITNFSF